MQAQGLGAPSINPCQLPACFSPPRRCRRGCCWSCIPGLPHRKELVRQLPLMCRIPGSPWKHTRWDKHRAHSHSSSRKEDSSAPPPHPLLFLQGAGIPRTQGAARRLQYLGWTGGTGTHPDTAPGQLKLLFPSSPTQPRARPACQQPQGKPGTAAPRSPVLCPSGERLGAAQPLPQTPLRRKTSAFGCCLPLPRGAACSACLWDSFPSLPPHTTSPEHFECADAPAS